jgi:hypothetical protein
MPFSEIYSECLTPWHELIDSAIMPHIQQRNKLSQPLRCSDDVYALMMSCWRLEAASRPSANDLTKKLIERMSVETVNRDSLVWPSIAMLRERNRAASTVSKDFERTSPDDNDNNLVDLESDKATQAFNAIKASHASLKLGDILGSGAFGEVRLGEWHSSSSSRSASIAAVKVAVKCLKGSSDTESADKFVLEARTLCALRHPNIVRILAVCVDEQPYYMVVEFMALGDYVQFLRKNAPPKETIDSVALKVPLIQLMSSVCQIADAMSYLEKMRVIHRDLAAR